MNEQLRRLQTALRAGVQRADVRAKQRSEAITLGVMHQYDLIIGFLQRIQPTLDRYSELHVFYFPIQSERLLCVYHIAGRPQAVPVKFRPYHMDTRLHAQKLFDKAVNKAVLSSEHPALETGHDDPHEIVVELIHAVLGGYLPRPYPKGTASLVLCCPIPPQITDASAHFRELSGVLILFGGKQAFSETHQVGEMSDSSDETSYDALATTLKTEFDKYTEETGRFVIRELDFFLSSLLSQDERVQDNQNRALGFMVHMLAHRFRSLRRVAEFIATEFPTVDAVTNGPEMYKHRMHDMKAQLISGQRLEKQLDYVGKRADVIAQSIDHLADIFKYVFDRTRDILNSEVQLEIKIPDDLCKERVISPQPVIEEVFYNHIENMLKAIDIPGIEDKVLTFRAYADANYICVDLINRGPPLPLDVLEDLQRTLRVRRPHGSGLGMFLSRMMMRHAGGDQEVLSPLRNSDKGVCVTLKFPRSLE